MIDAGFFSCNIGDRVIYIYCNLICQRWTPYSANPSQIHRKISLKCPYVISVLKCSETSSSFLTSEQPLTNQSPDSINMKHSRYNNISYAPALHTAYMEPQKRHESFASWSNKDSPSVDDLVKAGLFCSGTESEVKCFYCSGVLKNSSMNANLINEHARLFPHCEYVKQLYIPDLYENGHEMKPISRAISQLIDTNSQSAINVANLSSENASTVNESDLSRFVAARLDLPISQHLLKQNFKLSIVKRCWEDQLRFKYDDFVTDSDLFIACLIMQRQIDYVARKKMYMNTFTMSLVQDLEKKQQTQTSSEYHINQEICVTCPSDNRTCSNSEPIQPSRNSVNERTVEKPLDFLQMNSMKPSTESFTTVDLKDIEIIDLAMQELTKLFIRQGLSRYDPYYIIHDECTDINGTVR